MQSLILNILLMFSVVVPTHHLYNFTTETSSDEWKIEDDVVMGGRSSGHFEITKAGHGRFHGEVSLENNGGFSSVERVLSEVHDVGDATHFVLRVKGDGKRYRIRVKSDAEQRHSYEGEFSTSGDWETVEIPMADMYAIFHGDKLDKPNYPGEQLAVFRFMIGNGKAQEFSLLIDWIGVK